MKQVFFIDSENVGDSWLSLLALEEDELLVFYTTKTPYMNYESLIQLKESPKEVTFIKCFEGANALDFQLVSELGFRLSMGEADEYVIVTNDTGFDAVVRYWQKRGYSVRRMTGKVCRHYFSDRTEKKPERKEAVPADAAESEARTVDVAEQGDDSPLKNDNQDKKAFENETEANFSEIDIFDYIQEESAEQQPETAAIEEEKETSEQEQNKKEAEDEEEIKTIISCIGRNNLGDLHNSFELIYGEAGKEIYQKVKSNVYEVEPQKWNQKERFQKYCEIVFAHSDFAKQIPKEFEEYLFSAEEKRKNLNSLRAALQSEYGKDRGLKYYSLFKAHIKLMNRI